MALQQALAPDEPNPASHRAEAKESGQESGRVLPLAPSEEQIETVRRAWFGSWLGRATALVLMFAGYLGALGLVLKFFQGEFAALHAQAPLLFWALLTAPLGFILLFSVLPEALRLRRDRRLKATALNGQFAKPDYFRLRPYEERDRTAFRRDDNAHEEVLAWIQASETPLLYLTGSSGSGKSSLLAAWVLPNLKEQGWRTVVARSFDDPEAALTEALSKPGTVWDKPPQDTRDARVLIEKASDYLRGKGERLLLVLDQFEEFVILHDEARRARFAAFLRDLVARPVRSTTLLLVMRSDYTAFVGKLDLPQLNARENWYQVAPFLRPAAAAFLQQSGKQMPPALVDRMLKGLGEIEETPGLFRPITLNMLGLVLARAADRLEGHPERLIQRYLRNCLVDPDIRSEAPRILAPMITDAGTKQPRSAAELAEITGLEPWRVAGCLGFLDRHGLVRPLDRAGERWEIAHDFLARLIGQLLGRLRPPLWHRALPYTAPTLLVLWAATLLVGLPLWQAQADSQARQALARLNVSVTTEHGSGGAVVRFPVGADEESLKAAAGHLKAIQPLAVLDLNGTRVSELGPLARLTGLQSLSLWGTPVSELGPLAGLTGLQRLVLIGTQVSELGPVQHLEGLQIIGP